MTPRLAPNRRRLLHGATQLAAACIALPARASIDRTDAASARRLSLLHTHTGERIDLAYAVGEQRLPEALATLDRFLRDHYSGEVGRIDARLYDLLHRIALDLGASAPVFEIVSAYRCPATNARLREQRGGGVARRSLHLEGRALDVRLQGVALADLRDAACALRAGGVGFYARERFVHIDTGRVRTW